MNAAVIQVLQQASSQDPAVLKPAEQTLREWETQAGFYTALYVINYNLIIFLNFVIIGFFIYLIFYFF